MPRRRSLALCLSWLVACSLVAADGPSPPATTAPPSRFLVRGEGVEALRASVSLAGMDPGDPASVARTIAEVEAELAARVELEFGLVLAHELVRGYAGVVEKGTLRRAQAHEELEDLRRRRDRLAATRFVGTAGVPEPVGAGRLRVPVIVTATAGTRELQRTRTRVTVQKGADGSWRMTRAEVPCGSCSPPGGLAADGRCGVCAGTAWLERPVRRFGGDAATPPLPPGMDGAVPHEVALAFLRLRHALSRRTWARFGAALGQAHGAYLAQVLTPAALADLEHVPGPRDEVWYECGSAAAESESTVVAMLERVVSGGVRKSWTVLYVHLIGDARTGFRVASFGAACPACSGRARCFPCGGTGRDRQSPCRTCGGSGDCAACHGTRITPLHLLSPRF